VARLLEDARQRASGAGRPDLTVVGAGNCNDVELPRLVQDFGSVALVDVDGEAVRLAVEREGVTGHPGLSTHQLDVTGVTEVVDEFVRDGGRGDVGAVLRHLAAAASPASALPQSHVVLAAGLFSQVLAPLARSIARADDPAVAVLLALRLRLARVLLEMSSPGGQLLVVADMVSSATAGTPPAEPSELGTYVRHLVRNGNFFTGCNPYALQLTLREAGATDVRMTEPWIWHTAPEHWYLVHGLRAVRGPRTALTA
jgi:hypothetical protein